MYISLVINRNILGAPKHRSRMRASHDKVTHRPQVELPVLDWAERRCSPVHASSKLDMPRERRRHGDASPVKTRASWVPRGDRVAFVLGHQHGLPARRWQARVTQVRARPHLRLRRVRQGAVSRLSEIVRGLRRPGCPIGHGAEI